MSYVPKVIHAHLFLKSVQLGWITFKVNPMGLKAMIPAALPFFLADLELFM